MKRFFEAALDRSLGLDVVDHGFAATDRDEARGVIKACLELGKDPGETIAIFRIPGAWEDEGFKILERYGVEYCDRSVSMWEAAGRAVAKIQGAPA